MSFTSRLDAYQRHHSWLGLPIAVVYKFVDDQGGYLSALITYYGFLSLFPLLLVAVTVLGFLISGHPQVQSDVIGSALSQFPIIGKQIQSDLHGYTGSSAGLVVGLVAATYGGLGVAQAAQNALNGVWAVPRHARPNPVRARLRSLATVATLGVGVIVTTGISAVASGSQPYGIDLGVAGQILATGLAGVVNVVLFIGAYRYLTARPVSVRDVLVGAVVAGVAWQVLQSVGGYYVAHELRGAREVYGVFGVVLGLIAWIHIEAVIVVLCAELNVVLRRHLWPRALLTPFTDDVSLTRADEHAYDSYARAQQHKGFETIEVDFDDEHRDADQHDDEQLGRADQHDDERNETRHGDVEHRGPDHCSVEGDGVERGDVERDDAEGGDVERGEALRSTGDLETDERKGGP